MPTSAIASTARGFSVPALKTGALSLKTIARDCAQICLSHLTAGAVMYANEQDKCLPHALLLLVFIVRPTLSYIIIITDLAYLRETPSCPVSGYFNHPG